MCLTMEAKPKHIKPYCVFKNMKSASKLRWRLLRVTTEEDEALRQCRASAVRSTIRKYLRRQPKRAQLAKLGKVLGVSGKTPKGEAPWKDGRAAACVRRHPPGAMAPENTTQYLMSNVYDDMRTSTQAEAVSHSPSSHIYGEALSPRSVYAALDSDYENCLAYQQRDFEEAYGLCW